MSRKKDLKVNITYSNEVISEEEKIKRLAEFFYLLMEIDQDIKQKEKLCLIQKQMK